MYTEKQQKIFGAVLDLAKQGENLYTVKVQDIATAAGVGKGTLYEYFDSKEEILVHTMLWCLENELDALKASIAPGGSFEEDLTELQQCVAECMRQRGSIYRLIMSGFSFSELPGLAETYKAEGGQRLAEGRAVKAALIAKGRAEGCISPGCSDDYCHYVIDTALCSMASPLGTCTCAQGGRYSLTMVRKALA